MTRRFSAAAPFYRDAFRAKPALADELKAQDRLHSAIAAAQAGTNSNLAKDDIRLDGAERAQWRAQSGEWLRAEKNACARILAPTPPPTRGAPSAVASNTVEIALARRTLDIMSHHRNLACVRDEKELAKLPEPERQEWQRFWAEVATLLKNANQN